MQCFVLLCQGFLNEGRKDMYCLPFSSLGNAALSADDKGVD